MFYFIIRLLLSVGVAVLLFMGLLRAVRRNRKFRVKKRMQFFLPTVMAFLLTLFCIRSTGPKCLDLIKMLNGVHEVKQVTVESLGLMHSVRMDDGQVYYYNGFKVRLDPDRYYLISYTPWSRYITDIQEI